MKPLTTREYLILLVACVLTVLIVMKQCNKEDTILQSNTLYEHANDSVSYYKDKYNNQVASTYLLQGTNTALLLNMKTTNETIKWLQQEVRDNKDKVKDGGTVGVIGTTTNFTATTATTVLPLSNGEINPTYITQQTDSTWIVYKIVAKKDSTKFNLKVKNKYTVVFGEERTKVEGKLFKRKQPVALVTNKNPYTQVTEMKVFEVTNKVRKRISLSVGAGYCVPLFTFKPQPYIGVGVHYNIINLW